MTEKNEKHYQLKWELSTQSMYYVGNTYDDTTPEELAAEMAWEKAEGDRLIALRKPKSKSIVDGMLFRSPSEGLRIAYKSEPVKEQEEAEYVPYEDDTMEWSGTSEEKKCCAKTTKEWQDIDLWNHDELDKQIQKAINASKVTDVLEWSSQRADYTKTKGWGDRCHDCQDRVKRGWHMSCCDRTRAECAAVTTADQLLWLKNRLVFRCEDCRIVAAPILSRLRADENQEVCCDKLRRIQRDDISKSRRVYEYTVFLQSRPCPMCVLDGGRLLAQIPVGSRRGKQGRIEVARREVQRFEQVSDENAARGERWYEEVILCATMYSSDIATAMMPALRSYVQSYNEIRTSVHLAHRSLSMPPPPSQDGIVGWSVGGLSSMRTTMYYVAQGTTRFLIGNKDGRWICDHPLPRITMIVGTGAVRMAHSEYPPYPTGAEVFQIRLGCDRKCVRACLYFRAFDAKGCKKVSLVQSAAAKFKWKITHDVGEVPKVVMKQSVKKLAAEWEERLALWQRSDEF